MKNNSIIRTCLFIYECVKTILLAMILAFLLNGLTGTNPLPWTAFASPQVFFPLITLFLWIDACRFRNYLPLYIAGKCVSLVSFLSWSFFTGGFPVIHSNFAMNLLTGIVFQGSDLITIAAALYLIKNDKNFETEDVQCG